MPPPCPADANLVACFSFDSDTSAGTGVNNEVAGAPDGVGTGLAFAADLDGNALVLSGTGRVDVPHYPALDTATFTFEAWLKPTTLPPTGGSNRWGVMDKDGAFGLFLFNTGEVQCSAAGVGTVRSAPITAGEWIHAACTYDGAILSVLINGVVANATPISATPTLTTNELAVGANEPTGDNFVGRLDRVRLWKLARSASQVCLNQP